MWEQIENGRLHIKKTDMSATYHDPCRLARDLEESEPARKMIEAMGIDLNEMFLNRKLTKCCGGPLLSQNFSDLCNDITKVRWLDVSSADQNFLITSCPSCSLNFSKTKPEGMDTEDIFILLNSMC
jgi:Fe-S oxidoreductase